MHAVNYVFDSVQDRDAFQQLTLSSQTPLAAGRWPLAILGLPLMALSVAEAHAAFTSVRRTEVGAYLPSVLAMLAGNLLLLD